MLKYTVKFQELFNNVKTIPISSIRNVGTGWSRASILPSNIMERLLGNYAQNIILYHNITEQEGRWAKYLFVTIFGNITNFRFWTMPKTTNTAVTFSAGRECFSEEKTKVITDYDRNQYDFMVTPDNASHIINF